MTALDDLAAIAEPAFREIETTRYIVNFLRDHGIPLDQVFDTGCFGTIDCGADKTIALRADIDALPANPEGTEFRHLCGHHAHTAMLLLALKQLTHDPTAIVYSTAPDACPRISATVPFISGDGNRIVIITASTLDLIAEDPRAGNRQCPK